MLPDSANRNPSLSRESLHFETLETRQLLSAGLSGEYFDRANFTGDVITRTDRVIDMDFGEKAPIKGMGSHGYSVRWSGLVTPRVSEKHRFIVEFNGGARLWVDGKLLVDQWAVQNQGKESGSIKLKAGKAYDIRMEFNSESGEASARLLWRSDSTRRQIIPKSNMEPYDKRFAVIGDYGEGSTEAKDVAKLIESWNPAFIISTGDNNYTGSMDLSVGQFFHKYIRKYKGAYGEGAEINRFFPSVGNHDWSNDINAYTSFFSLPGKERYYDFVRGPVHFYSISSDGHEPDGNTSTSKQGKWLKKELRASTSEWNIVYFHHPAYSSGRGHGSTPNMQWPFEEWGADVVISGHDHLYERLAKDDVTYFVNGLGGSHVYGFGAPLPESRKQFNGDFGAMLVQATDEVVTFQFITRAGRMVDSHTLRDSAEPSEARAAGSVMGPMQFSKTDLFSRKKIDEPDGNSWWESISVMPRDAI
jgi:hypothetical protein